jgi:hypothetical protein
VATGVTEQTKKSRGLKSKIIANKSTQKLIALNVSTYIDKPEDNVVFEVICKNLQDGTQYPVTTSLVADAQNLKIVIEQSDLKKGAGL